MRALNRAFEDTFGVLDAFSFVPMPGRTDQAIVDEALRYARVRATPEQRDTLRATYCRMLEEEITKPGPRKGILPGVVALLDAVRQREDSFPALLTGNFSAAARTKLMHFGLWHYFPCGAFGDDAFDRNALVQVATARASACGAPSVASRDVVVIGDTPLDVACARAAGARAVAVATGSSGVSELEAAGADVVFADLADTGRVVDYLGT